MPSLTFLSNNSVQNFAKRYHDKGILIDTNLLLLLLFGLFDKNKLNQFKCVARYESTDFDVLYKILRIFKSVVVTPQILAEITNIAKVSDPHEQVFFQIVVQQLKLAKEKYFKKDNLLSDILLAKVGFTDLTILAAAKKRRLLVVTEDLPLTLHLRARDCDVLNLNDIRTLEWLR